MNTNHYDEEQIITREYHNIDPITLEDKLAGGRMNRSAVKIRPGCSMVASGA